MVYIGIYYNVLRGADCNCFPWIKRVVGPAFFVSDLVMLALAVIAGWWARPAASRRSAVLVLLAVAVFAAVSYGVNARIEASVAAPASIHVEGKPFALRHGRVLLFFFDPECTHCDEAARAMSKLRWESAVTIIAIPTESPQFAGEFLHSTGLSGSISSDAALLRKTFSFVSTPYAVALENGRDKASLSRFDEQEPEQTLRRLHFIH
jgi:thiol-disulfide isomerase/thioredoxin